MMQSAFDEGFRRAMEPWKGLRAWHYAHAGDAPVAQTPADVVYRERAFRLLRYPTSGSPAFAVPLLMVPSIINRYYILDLTQGRSVVEYLRDAGFDVWMVDWVLPEAGDRFATLDEYADSYLVRAVDEVRMRTGAPAVSLLGYCIGGVLTSIFTALRPERVRGLITLAAPIDFRESGLLGLWSQAERFPVDLLVDTFGNVPAWLLQASFKWLRPTTELRNALTVWDRADDLSRLDDFKALNRWVEDSVPVAGEAYRRFVRECYQQNLLVQGRLQINGRSVDLGAIRCPVLAVVAEQDHICPAPAGSALLGRVSSRDAAVLAVPGGHIGAIVGREAREVLWPRLREWLSARSEPRIGARRRAARRWKGMASTTAARRRAR